MAVTLMQAREYQTDLIERARDELRIIQARLKSQGITRKPRLMIQLGCGGGKTFVASLMTRACVDKGGRSVFVVHRDFLLEQTSLTYQSGGIDHSFLAAGRNMDISMQAHIGMVGSMKSRMGKIQTPTLCFLDEGHHGTAKTWSDIEKAWPDTTFIFLSATPHRSDKIGLDQICDGIVLGPSNAELIAMGALSDYIYYTPSKPDLSGVTVRMGEYVTTELDEEMSKAKIVGNIVGSYKQYAPDTRAVYFATSVSTSRGYAEAFKSSGINAVHLDAESTAQERKDAAVAMALGRLNVICNVGLFGEGFDLAAHAGMPVTIETVGLCRPTKSLPLLIQQQMRCMRAKPYPGIILDHAGCYAEHNFLPDDPIEWSLKGAKRSELVSTYQCMGCGSLLRRGVGVCTVCGEDATARIAEIKRNAELEHVAGELERVERENRQREEEHKKKLDQIARGRARTLEELVAFGKSKGYASGWARMVYNARRRA